MDEAPAPQESDEQRPSAKPKQAAPQRRERPPKRQPKRDGQQRQGQQRSQRSGGRGRQKWSVAPIDVVRRSFFGCGRCSYFYSGVRALIGVQAVNDVVLGANKGWLTLPWSQAMRMLVERNFGLDIHSDTSYLQGSCNECGRMFTVMSEPDSAELGQFEIQSERQAHHLR